MLNSGVQIFVARCLWLVLAAAVLPGCRALFPTDGERFERAGVQVGQPLPEVDLTSLDGHTHPWASAWGDRPAVFIAVSRSCPVARYRMMDVRLLRDTFGEQVKLVVMDLSFISLTKVLPAAFEILEEGGSVVSLIKPQFELPSAEVGDGGIVRDESAREKAVDKIRIFITEELGREWCGVMTSPITGTDGNVEFLAWIK